MDNENPYKELVKNLGCLLRLKSVKESGAIPVDDVRKLIPELNESENEMIKRCIQVALTDVDEKRFNDYDTTLKDCLAWLEKQGEKVDVIENFDTEFEKQVSRLLASVLSKEYEYTEGFVKWVSNSLLGYAKYEIEKQGEKTSWSEEDEKFTHGLIRGLTAKRDIYGHTTFSNDCIDITDTINWLKSLKDRVQPQQTLEWGEEDDYILNLVSKFVLKGYKSHPKIPSLEFIQDWLKSLKPQNHWKPSEEKTEIEYKLVEQKPVYKVDPKFRNGKWIVWQDKCYKVNYNDCGYELVDQNGLNTSLGYATIDENAHLWDVTKDAKDGDVLATDDGNICIFDGTVEDGKYPFAYCGLIRYGFEFCDRKLPFTHDNVCPATKEQRELLFQKMKEAGYEWNSEKKELKKIEQKPYPETLDKAIELYYYSYGNGKGGFDNLSLEKFKDIIKTFVDDYGNKSAWSEDDKIILSRVKWVIDSVWHNLGLSDYDEKEFQEMWEWLDEIWRRVAYPQPKQEWSEEDKVWIDRACMLLDELNHLETLTLAKIPHNVNDIINHIKSLKPNHWKPREEQMDAFHMI